MELVSSSTPAASPPFKAAKPVSSSGNREREAERIYTVAEDLLVMVSLKRRRSG